MTASATYHRVVRARQHLGEHGRVGAQLGAGCRGDKGDLCGDECDP